MKKKQKKDRFLEDVADRFKDFNVSASKDVWNRIEQELDANDGSSVKRLDLEEREQIIRFLKYGSAS